MRVESHHLFDAFLQNSKLALPLGGTLRQGFVFLQRTRILSGIQFKQHFIEFVFVQRESLSVGIQT